MYTTSETHISLPCSTCNKICRLFFNLLCPIFQTKHPYQNRMIHSNFVNGHLDPHANIKFIFCEWTSFFSRLTSCNYWMDQMVDIKLKTKSLTKARSLSSLVAFQAKTLLYGKSLHAQLAAISGLNDKCSKQQFYSNSIYCHRTCNGHEH